MVAYSLLFKLLKKRMNSYLCCAIHESGCCPGLVHKCHVGYLMDLMFKVDGLRWDQWFI